MTKQSGRPPGGRTERELTLRFNAVSRQLLRIEHEKRDALTRLATLVRQLIRRP